MKKLIDSDLVVVKVGTNLLTDTSGDTDTFDDRSYQHIADEINRLSSEGASVILVSSGAISAGIISEGKDRKYVTSLPDVQRYATRGWSIVVNKWKEAIGESRVSVSLLTKSEIHNPGTRAQMLSVIGCCLSHDDIFLINENDCISDFEIRYGDNDVLASEVAVACSESRMFKSVRLVMLTTANGLNRVASDDTTLIREVKNISDVEGFAGGSANEHSRGGMQTKVQAAKLATVKGVDVYVANGRADNVIFDALSGKIGTRFLANPEVTGS